MIHHVNSFIIPDDPVGVTIPFITTAITHDILPGATLSASHKDAMLNIAIEQDIRQLNPSGMVGAMAAVAGASINNCSIITMAISDYIIQELVLNPVFNITMYGIPRTLEELDEVIDETTSERPGGEPPYEPWDIFYNPAYKTSYSWHTRHLSYTYNTIAFFASYVCLTRARNYKDDPTDEEIETYWKAKLPIFWMLFYIYFAERIRIFQYFIPVPCIYYGFGVYFQFSLEAVACPVRQLDVANQKLVDQQFVKYQTIYTKFGTHTCLMQTLGEEISQAFVHQGTDPLMYLIDKLSDPATVLKKYEEVIGLDDFGEEVIKEVTITVSDMMVELGSLWNTCKSMDIAWLYNKNSDNPVDLAEGLPADGAIPIYDDFQAFNYYGDNMWKHIKQNMINILDSSYLPGKSIACLERKPTTGVWGETPHDILLYDSNGQKRIFKRDIRPPLPDNHKDHLFWELKAEGSVTELSNTNMDYDQSQLFPDGMVFKSVEEAMTYHVMNCCPYYVSLNRLTCSQGSQGLTVLAKGPIYTATLSNRIPGMYYKHKAEVIIGNIITNVVDNLSKKNEDHYGIDAKTGWINGFGNQVVSSGSTTRGTGCEGL